MLTRLILLYILVVLFGCASFNREPPPELTADGLQPISSPDFDELYILPQSDFSQYDSVYVADVQIEFERGWQANQNLSDPFRITDRDIKRIKRLLGEEVLKVFKHDLAAGTNYEIVDKPGPHTLIITPNIVDLYINAPFNSRGYRITVLGEQAGRMALNLELTDAATNQVLLRLADRRRTRNSSFFQIQGPVRNLQESRRLLHRWSESLILVLSS
jgi:hypothetical protein